VHIVCINSLWQMTWRHAIFLRTCLCGVTDGPHFIAGLLGNHMYSVTQDETVCLHNCGIIVRLWPLRDVILAEVIHMQEPHICFTKCWVDIDNVACKTQVLDFFGLLFLVCASPTECVIVTNAGNIVGFWQNWSTCKNPIFCVLNIKVTSTM